MDNKEVREESKSGWAAPVSQLQVGDLPAGAINLNVAGRHLTGPLQGFGQMWQKTYRIRLSGAQVSPQEVIRVWKEKFPEFWPESNYFYGPLTGISPGEVGVLNLAVPGGLRLSTGVMVIYADDLSFTFMTPEGHTFAAWITFSAEEDEGATVVQIQPLIRASDPVYEMGLRIGLIHKMEDQFWHQTLLNLATHFGVQGYVEQKNSLIDPRLQWRYVTNIWHNAGIRSGIYMVTTPLRWLRGLFAPKAA